MQPDETDELLRDLIDAQFAADICHEVAVDVRVEFDPVLGRHMLKLADRQVT